MPTTNTVVINEIPVSTTDNTLTAWGPPLSAQYFFVLANGTSAAETFDAADISSATLARMATYTRGASIVMGDGDDTVIGSAYGDVISAGAGTNLIDGGANLGTDPGGYKAMDTLNIFVTSSAADAALSVTAISSSGADAAQYAAGYRIKVVNGAETGYLKGVEQVNVFMNNSYQRSIALVTNVSEVGGSQDPATMMHLAWVQGSAFNDSFDASADISSGTAAMMATHGRGVWADMGAGDDTVAGSIYGDDINAGAGTNYVDGGANGGSPPWGGKAQDVLHVTVASQAAANAVTVTQLAAGAGSAADQAAAAANYTHKVVSGTDVSYIKGIERVSIEIVNGGTNTFARDIPLAVVVNEANLSDPSIGNYYHLAWANGTAGADSIDMSGSTALLSSALRTALDTRERGVWVDGGAGNDTITGTGYADNFRNGAGNSKIDGGANDGPAGELSRDVFEVTVASTAAMAAVTVAASDDPAYTWMVTYGTGEKDYLKNVEAIAVNVAGTATGKWIPLEVSVHEIGAGGDLANSMHYAWAEGTAQGDNFDAASAVSAATQTLMSNNGRGIWVNTGDGNDTVVASGFGDDINAGKGSNYVDGGANAGSPPWGGKAQDVLHVTVASQAAAGAVTVTKLSASSTGAELAAFNDGYEYKVSAGSDVTYAKGIERVSIEISDGSTNTFVRDIPLVVVAREANLADAGVAQSFHLAWVEGTQNADTIDLSGATALLSAPLRTALGTYSHGVWVDGGAGNDTITGTAYGDNFRNGSGNSYIDGGANAGPAGQQARDVFEITVATTAAMNEVRVEASDDAGYTWMVVYGSTGQKDYLKNIEAVTVNVNGTSTGKWIPLAVNVNEIDAATGNPSESMHHAWVQGTGLGDSFDAASGISSATHTLMATNGRGIYMDMGAGDDTVVGSAYGDDINAGAGTNYIDGGANGGSPPWGGQARDVLHVSVATQAAAAAVSVTALAGATTGADAAALGLGYTHKVTANGETDYIKGIERVSIELVSGSTSTFVRDIPLAVVVDEANLADTNSAGFYHLAWVNGTGAGDTIDLSGSTALLSGGIRAEMASSSRGLWVNGGAGDDTITGTSYSDNFVNGAGNSKIDGGDNIGANGLQGRDVFEITVASTTELSAIQVALSDDPAYSWMVTYGATGQKDYLKNIEAVSVSVNGTSTGRYISLAMRIDEIQPTSNNLSNSPYYAWVEGTAKDESFNAATDISSDMRALMAQNGRGVSADLGAGNDTIVGSAYGDVLAGGAGTNYIDGAGSAGRMPNGQKPVDMLDMFVANQTQANAVQVQLLDAGMTGADAAAFAAGYKFRISNGSTEVDYVKNLSSVNVRIWNDKDGDGVRDYSTNASVNEVTLGRTISLTANTAPTFKGTAPGVSITDAGQDFGAVGGVVLPGGKLLTVSYIDSAINGDNYSIYLTRNNADGSVDTSFGGGTGRVEIPTAYAAVTAPVVQADGKVLVSVSTPGSPSDIKVLRLNADGTLDTAFGSGGSVVVGVASANDTPRQILLQADGKIVVAGTGNGGASSTNDFALLRLNADGTLDTSFNGSGKLVVPVGTGPDSANAAVLQADGKIVVAGTVGSGSAADYGLVRINADGTLDSSFGTGGKQVLAVGPGGDAAYVLTLQADGKLIAAGYSRSGSADTSDWDMSLVRLNADGSLDSSFGTGGKVVTHVGNLNDRIFAIQVQPDGKIVTAGTMNVQLSSVMSGQFAITRYNANGTLDTSFGNGGIATVPGHGMGDQAASLGLANGKIVLFGSTFNDLQANVSNVIARLNADGTLDDSFATGQASSVGGTVTANGLRPKVLDTNAAIYDADLNAKGSYAGATLTLSRQGGAAAEDLFSASGDVSFANGNVSVGGIVIGTVAQSGGTLTLTFNAQSSQGMVNRAMHGIAYSNGSATPPSSLVIDWTFSDGNTGAQGLGAAYTATASTTVQIAATIDAVERSKIDPALSTLLNNNVPVPLSSLSAMATVEGTAGADTVSQASFSSATLALMAEFQRGATFLMGAGNDTVGGTGYSDVFVLGGGVNCADGGANAGPAPGGSGSGRDMLVVYAPNASAAAAVAATKLTGSATGEDLAAFNAGYDVKVVNGSEINYVRNIELVSVQVWNDANGNGVRDNGEVSWVRDIPLAMLVNEVRVSTTDPTKTADGQPLASSFSMAWGEGSMNADTFNAASDVSSATQALMASYGRGVWVDGRGGDDTITGSGFGDDFTGGAGTNYIDGGANAGTMANGGAAIDMLQVYTASTAEADAVAVTALTSSMSGADGAAYAAGYRFKVVNGATETDYVKNIEQVNVQVWNDKDGDGQRDYSSDSAINEVTYSRGVALTTNTAPSFTGVAPGVALDNAGIDFGVLGGTVLASGKLLAVSYYRASPDDSNYVLVLNRSNADGSQDNTFGSSGRVTLPTSYDTVAGPLELSDGKLLVAVGTQPRESADVRVMRLNADGSLDTSFGSGGYQTVSFSAGRDTVSKLLADPASGKITVVGSAGGGADLAVLRLNANGSLDTSFDGDGKLVLDLSASDNAASAALQADGKLVIAGSGVGANPDFMAVRVNTDGTLDSGFGAGGKVLVPVGVGSDVATSIKVQADGKLLLSGQFRTGTTTASDLDNAWLRLNADGSRDTGFGTNGLVKLHIGDGSDRTAATELLADGKILTLATVNGNSQGIGAAFLLGRLNPDGSIDAGFGNNGSVYLPVLGIGDQAYSLQLVNGKIVIFGSTQNDMNFNQSNVLIRLNADGSRDASFNPSPASTLGNTVVMNGVFAEALNENAAIFDAQLAARGNYAGASLTLSRQGGADASDIFVGVGEVSFQNGELRVNGIQVGWANSSAGTLTIHFNDIAVQGMVTRVLHGIGYANSSGTPPSSVTIDWVFNDGNDGSQGFGGALAASGSTTVQFQTRTWEAKPSNLDSSKAALPDGAAVPMEELHFFAEAYGTNGNDSFNAATGFSSAVQALMSTYGRGAQFAFAGGDDTITGTGYSDLIYAGAGTNRIDGGANAGTHPWYGNAKDILEIFVNDQAGANAVQAIQLDGSSTGADATAYSAGYTLKIVNGSEIDYVKNIELVTVSIGQPGPQAAWARDIVLATQYGSITLKDGDPTKASDGRPLADIRHFAWANGGLGNDVADAAVLPQSLRDLMQANGRGMYFDMGAGNDTVTGSAWSDNIVAGAGINRVDGGANGGTTPDGQRPSDTLEIYVATTADGNAATATVLDAGGTGADQVAFSEGYQFKIVAGGETDYVKNIEAVNIFTYADSNGNGQRDPGESQFLRQIPLSVMVNEQQVNASDATKDPSGNLLSTYMHLAWFNGSLGNDTVVVSSQLSTSGLALLGTVGRGVFADLGAGNDTITASGFGDNVTLGTGTNYYDGGANAGSDPQGNPAQDVLEVYVSNSSEASAVSLTALTTGMSGADGAAYDAGYRFRVNSVDEVDYLVNVERVTVQIWNDLDHDGQRDYAGDASNEVTFVAQIPVP
ncbi:beta strand repeat-containing protein [Pseudoduganella rhizocola]|uniref:beta strand repeat-containing protein n=1 Tax=Pseudoduganella rhizocola TaxID=3382643 RepID=UPI0038B61131